jgi:hypothetical protein
MTLSTHDCVVPKLRIIRALLPLLVYAFLAWLGKTSRSSLYCKSVACKNYVLSCNLKIQQAKRKNFFSLRKVKLLQGLNLLAE